MSSVVKSRTGEKLNGWNLVETFRKGHLRIVGLRTGQTSLQYELKAGIVARGNHPALNQQKHLSPKASGGSSVTGCSWL